MSAMNFKYINRKQRLGISHPDDFSQWAGTLLVEREKEYAKYNEHEQKLVGKVTKGLYKLADGNYSLWEDFTPKQMQHSVQWFNEAIDGLALDFQHAEVEDTYLAKTVQSIDTEVRKRDIFFSIIDIRPISELGKNLGDIELLDKMVVECGCNPLGDYWQAYSPEDGRQTLQVIFEYEVRPYAPSNARLSENNILATQFLACFDESVRFFGNDAYAPWAKDYQLKTFVQSKSLQSTRDLDFGLVVCDDKHVGFLLLAADHY